MKLLKRIIIAILIILVGLQFIPTRTNQSNEKLSSAFEKAYHVTEDAKLILINSCYNCHSNNTNYPWYSRVQPIGLYLENHINKGKEQLNFSEFGTYSIRNQKSKLTSMVYQIENGSMPLASYTFIHRDAQLNQKDKNVLTDYLHNLKDSLQ